MGSPVKGVKCKVTQCPPMHFCKTTAAERLLFRLEMFLHCISSVQKVPGQHLGSSGCRQHCAFPKSCRYFITLFTKLLKF